ncbi:MAG: DUF2723 domain-containing protein [Chloroflexota bacterium]
MVSRVVDHPLVAILTRYLSIILSVAVGLLLYAAYQKSVAPSVATIFDDSLEFPLVVHRLAIAHPTGYPLYTLLGKIFSWFDLTNVAYQLNVMSAFFGALTVTLLYLVCLEIQQLITPNPQSTVGNHLGALIASVVFGLGPVTFSQATIAEVYTLNAAFIAGILLLALQRRWILLAWCVGLSQTHHRTAILILPAIILFFLFSKKEDTDDLSLKNPVILLQLGLGLTIPQLIYLYLPWRGHIGSLDGTYEASWSGFLRHILGGGYGNTFLAGNPFGAERSSLFYLDIIVTEVGWIGLGIGLAGLGLLLYRRQWSYLILTGGAFITFFVFNIFYSVADIVVFFIPVFLIISIWMSIAIGSIFSWRWLQNPALASILCFIIILILFTQHRGESRTSMWEVHDYGQDTLSQPLPEGAAIIGILGEMTLIRYFQEVSGLRPDIQTIAADLDEDRFTQIEAHLSQQSDNPAYLTRPLKGTEAQWSFSAMGPLIQVRATPSLTFTPPPLDTPIQQRVDMSLIDEIRLVHYAITRPKSHQSRDPVRLTLTWQAQNRIPDDYKISARLIDLQEAILSSMDKTPVHFAYPTSAWRSGEFVTDVYDLTLPPDMVSGEYSPLIILYDPANNAAEVGRITLPPTYIP